MRYVCVRCVTEREDDQFYVYPGGKRHPYCRTCTREIDRSRDGQPGRRDKTRRVRADRRKQIQSAKSRACTDCLESYPYFVMDFDHIGKKTANMSSMLSAGALRIEAEASRCEVVCANCHRERTHKRQMNEPPGSGANFVRGGPGASRRGAKRRSRYGDVWQPTGPFCGDTKACHRCERSLPVEWFNRRSNDRTKFASNCRPCSARYQEQWYTRHASGYKDRIRPSRRRLLDSRREYIRIYKEERGCADCDRTYPSYVLDFDHTADNKVGLVSRMAGTSSFEALLLEIAKCEVVCANCHRYRTHARRLARIAA